MVLLVFVGRKEPPYLDSSSSRVLAVTIAVKVLISHCNRLLSLPPLRKPTPLADTLNITMAHQNVHPEFSRPPRTNSMGGSTSGSSSPSSPSNDGGAGLRICPLPLYSPSSDLQRPWCCPSCDYRASRLYNCQRHMMTTCGRRCGYQPDPIRCVVQGCRATRNRVDHLKTHVKDAHPCDDHVQEVLLKVVDLCNAQDEEGERHGLRQLQALLDSIYWTSTGDGFSIFNNTPFSTNGP